MIILGNNEGGERAIRWEAGGRDEGDGENRDVDRQQFVTVLRGAR